MAMSQSAPAPPHELQNGLGGDVGRQEGDADRHQAESLSAQAQAEAEELLSRAQVHAELLRAHAETARAEAQSLRAEAHALRRAVGEEASAVASRAEAMLADVHATAEQVRSAMEAQAAAARAEVERMRTEAVSLRRLLQAEIDAGMAGAQQMRADLQDLRADTDKLASQLQLLPAPSATAPARPAPTVGDMLVDEIGPPKAERRPAREVAERLPTADGRVDDPRRAIAVEVERRLTYRYPDADDPGPGPDSGPVLSPADMGKLLKEIWDDLYTEAAPLPERGFREEADPPEETDRDRPRASEPLIGSGGWRASTARSSAAAPVDGPGHGEAASRPGAGRSRRFRRSR